MALQQNPPTALTDGHIHYFQALLRRQHDRVDGWQAVQPDIRFLWLPASHSVQIMHDGENHWLVSAQFNGRVRVVDSYHAAEPNEYVCRRLLELYAQPLEAVLEVTCLKVQRQHGETQCGDFAIAFADALANDKKDDEICALQFDQSAMRAHLLSCSQRGLSPFPLLSSTAVLPGRSRIYRIRRGSPPRIEETNNNMRL